MIARDESLRIGVYVCHCGTNIAGTVNVEALAKFAEELPYVALSRHYKYMCSDPGQEFVKRDIREFNLNRIVVAACSPNLHEPTFRRAAEDAGLNRFLVQMANIREQVAWVTVDKVAATDKAKAHLAAAVRRVAGHEALQRQFVRIVPRALVVGGGIAGIEAALTLADAGKEVILVEREPSIGGHMAMFDKTFPTLDCAACILTPKMTAVKLHPNIKLLTYSSVDSVEGSVGSYRVKVRRRPRYIDESLCVGCMMCIDQCASPGRGSPTPSIKGWACANRCGSLSPRRYRPSRLSIPKCASNSREESASRAASRLAASATRFDSISRNASRSSRWGRSSWRPGSRPSIPR